MIRLPDFVPIGGFQPNPQKKLEELENRVLAAFEQVEDARGLIWDVRANTGGATPVGLSIAEGMPGAKSTEIASCHRRIPDTDPPRYNDSGPDYQLEPGGDFQFDGPAAILVDGLTFSAGDYFARAVKKGTDALVVGQPTAGAYGGSGATFRISREPDLVAGYDPFRCDAPMGMPLETLSVEPDVRVEYDPNDLADGTDTMLEVAADRLKDNGG